MVTTEDNALELQPHILGECSQGRSAKHKDTDRYVPEPNIELPHWMKFQGMKSQDNDSQEHWKYAGESLYF